MNKKDVCIRGHVLILENKDNSGRCKACRNIRNGWRKHSIRDRARRRTPDSRYRVFLAGAKVRELEVTLTFEDFKKLISSKCYYCQESLPETGSGIDRVNSNIGYVQGNCRPCCTQCNRAKSDKTEDQFKEWILKVFNNWIKR